MLRLPGFDQGSSFCAPGQTQNTITLKCSSEPSLSKKKKEKKKEKEKNEKETESVPLHVSIKWFDRSCRSRKSDLQAYK